MFSNNQKINFKLFNNNLRFNAVKSDLRHPHVPKVRAVFDNTVDAVEAQATPIQRFTYDWLIRFVELHPINTEASSRFQNDTDYNRAIFLRFKRLSPLFSHLVHKYVPYVSRVNAVFKDDNVAKFQRPSNKKVVVLTGDVSFLNVHPGTISQFKGRNIFFNGLTLFIEEDSVITPDELKYVARGCSYICVRGTTLTESFPMSHLWPYLGISKVLYLMIKNLVYDVGMNHALLHGNSSVYPLEVKLSNVPPAFHFIDALLDWMLSMPAVPETMLIFPEETKEDRIIFLKGAIERRLKPSPSYYISMVQSNKIMILRNYLVGVNR